MCAQLNESLDIDKALIELWLGLAYLARVSQRPLATLSSRFKIYITLGHPLSGKYVKKSRVFYRKYLSQVDVISHVVSQEKTRANYNYIAGAEMVTHDSQ